MKVKLNTIFLMSVLLLGLTGYPSSQLNSENNVDISDNFLLPFPNLAHADDEEDEEHDDEEHDDEKDEDHDDEDHDDEKDEEHDDEKDEEHEDEDENEEKDEFKIEGIVEFIDLISQSFTLDNGEEIFVDEDTEFEHFDSLSDLQDFAVEVEVVLSSNSLIATEIEIEDEHEDKEDDEHEESKDKDESEEDDEDHLSNKAMHEQEEESIQTALDLIQELQQKIDHLEDRIQTLLEKYESGKYFGTVPEVDSEIKSYVISFDGSATSIDGESIVDAEGQIFIENLLTIDDDISKFRVTGGEISIDNTFYDLVFGKARVSSSGSFGEIDTVVLLGQVIDFADEDDDSSTLKLVMDSETTLEGDFGLESISIEILPQSKIAGHWYLSGSGDLSLLDG